MRTITTIYEPIKVQAVRTGKCSVCNGHVKRSRTFTQTISPFNRNDLGLPKDHIEVRASVEAEAKAWAPDFDHYTCTSAVSD